MGACRTADSSCKNGRAQAHNEYAADIQRRHVRTERRLPMALSSQGLSAAWHGVSILRDVELVWHARSHSRGALREVPRTSGTRGQSHRRHYRQPEREERRKRGASIDPHGFDAGKKIKGKKRHILVDTLGLLLGAIVHSAGVQDRDGGVLLLSTLFGRFPFIEKLFADSAYQGPIFANALAKILPRLDIEIVKRSDSAKGFVKLPKRWIVERSIAWLNRCRRLAKDWENLNRTALAFLRFASIRLMLRKLCNPA